RDLFIVSPDGGVAAGAQDPQCSARRSVGDRRGETRVRTQDGPVRGPVTSSVVAIQIAPLRPVGGRHRAVHDVTGMRPPFRNRVRDYWAPYVTHQISVDRPLVVITDGIVIGVSLVERGVDAGDE